WDWAISPLPQPPPPKVKHSNEAIPASSIPLVSPVGFTRPASKTEFLRSRLLGIAVCYLLLDVLSIIVQQDPYLMLGPRVISMPEFYPPAYLSFLPPSLLPLYRCVIFLPCIVTAVSVIFLYIDLMQYYLLSSLFPIRSEPWIYASIWGPATYVLDHGLAGLWGVCWHQSFRAVFVYPVYAIWGRGHGSLPGKQAALLVWAFFSSGLLHSVGSYTATPYTDWLDPMRFFALQGVGVFIQSQSATMLRSLGVSRNAFLRRAGNLVFAAVWSYMTLPLIADDMASMAIWTMEPNIYSPLRALGFGYAGDSAWRWWDLKGGFYVGKYWWEFGYGL
ncbi:hypothetical protein TD95_003689, partial [Thielaviopsis punctulata]